MRLRRWLASVLGSPWSMGCAPSLYGVQSVPLTQGTEVVSLPNTHAHPPARMNDSVVTRTLNLLVCALCQPRSLC